jgi:hypothetical protein
MAFASVMQCRSGPSLAVAAVPLRVLQVDRIGYLVPPGIAEAVVDSSFRRACNLALGSTLLTLHGGDAGAQPTGLQLAPGSPSDLRALFSPGERVRGDAEGLRTGRVAVRWRRARVWRPAPAPAPAEPDVVAARLARAAQRLRTAATLPLVDVDARCAALGRACRADDRLRVVAIARDMVGRGEGLTPACDDALMGLFAGLEFDAPGPEPCAGALAALRQAVLASLARTTPIAAHGLRLAAGAHHGEHLLGLREALTASAARTPLTPALDAVLSQGASSGVALAAGLIAGIGARLRPTGVPGIG